MTYKIRPFSGINSKISILFLIFFLSLFTSFAQTGFTVKTDTLDAAKYGFFSIPEIDFEIERINNYLNITKRTIEKLNVQLDADTSYNVLLDQIKKDTKHFYSYESATLSNFFLENSHRSWSSYKARLTEIRTLSFSLLNKSEERNLSLEKQEKTWKKTSENSRKHKIPDVQIKKIKEIQKRINKQHNDNYKISLRILNHELEINEQYRYVDEMLSHIENLQSEYKKNLFSINTVPIWKISLFDSTERSVKASFQQAWYDNTNDLVSNYNVYRPDFSGFLFYALLIFLFHYILRKKYVKRFGANRMRITEDLRFLVLYSPITSFLSAVVLMFFMIFENIPLGLSNIISLMLLVLLFIAIKNYLNHTGRLIIKSFILLMLLNIFEIVIWYAGDFSRIYLLFESLVGIWLTYRFVMPNFSRDELSHLRFSKLIGFIRYPIFFLFLGAFIANTFGYEHLTVYNQRIAVKFTSLIIIIVGMWYVVNSYIQLLSDVLSRVEIFRFNTYLPLLKKRITQIFQLYFIYVLFNSILNLFDLKSPFYKALFKNMEEVQQVGSISFTYGDILTFILILSITWTITAIIKMVFDEDNYQKYDSIRGIPAAISMTLRIIFFSAGLFFAFSAAGFDMTSLSMILGALGVGIGFGLQNVVNNYISGLILIYERPVQKGDTVEVNNLMGDVVDIGIRRSTLRTFDGAEVIIPNSNLTSNHLINWTLSDKHRRLDIKIGVAYGTDPNLIIDLLKEVAEKNKMVVNMPAPMVLFDDFGDSSLNFRLLCWVLFSNGLTARSDIRVAISNAFKEKNIEIPFPQVDLHVKDTPKEAAVDRNRSSKAKLKAKAKDVKKAPLPKSTPEASSGPVNESSDGSDD